MPDDATPLRRSFSTVPAVEGLVGLRRIASLSQAQLASRLGLSQAVVQRAEHQVDPRVSVLRRYAEASGGELEIRVALPDGRWAPLRLPEP